VESNNAVGMAEHIARCASSGLTCAEYARRENISLKNLYNVRTRARARLKLATSKKVLASKVQLEKAVIFKPVRVSEPVGLDVSVQCVLLLTGGHRLEINRLPDPQWLLALSSARLVTG
jgi:hypothetical protein